MPKVTREIDYDNITYMKNDYEVSVRTSEYDSDSRCVWQKIKLGEDGRKIMEQLQKWIDINLK